MYVYMYVCVYVCMYVCIFILLVNTDTYNTFYFHSKYRVAKEKEKDLHLDCESAASAGEW